MGKCNQMMKETEPVFGGEGRAGEVRQPISTRKGKEGTWGDRACLWTASMPLPSPALSASLLLHITSQISVLHTFSWGWNVQTFSHGLLSGPTETRWLLNQTLVNGTHSNSWVLRGTYDFTWTLGMMCVPPEVTLQPLLSHTLGEAFLLASRPQTRADHNEHQQQQIIINFSLPEITTHRESSIFVFTV